MGNWSHLPKPCRGIHPWWTKQFMFMPRSSFSEIFEVKKLVFIFWVKLIDFLLSCFCLLLVSIFKLSLFNIQSLLFLFCFFYFYFFYWVILRILFLKRGAGWYPSPSTCSFNKWAGCSEMGIAPTYYKK